MTVTAKTLPIHTPQKIYVKTSLGRKILMAVTGVFMVGFVFGHMLGNLQIFLGQNQLNTYAQALKDLPALTWTVRLAMIIAVLIHIWNGVRLYLQNRSSRPIGYVRTDTVQATLASRTMFWTGLGTLLYVVYHLLHFTFIVTNRQYEHLTDAMGRHDVYSMVILGFTNPLISVVYIVALFLVAYHLSHAISSMFQTVGWNRPCVQPVLKAIAYILAVVAFVGYASVPIAVLLNIVTLPGGGI